jgi:hypothetical protein
MSTSPISENAKLDAFTSLFREFSTFVAHPSAVHFDHLYEALVAYQDEVFSKEEREKLAEAKAEFAYSQQKQAEEFIRLTLEPQPKPQPKSDYLSDLEENVFHWASDEFSQCSVNELQQCRIYFEALLLDEGLKDEAATINDQLSLIMKRLRFYASLGMVPHIDLLP